MQNYFSGVIDLFAPHTEIKKMNVQNIFMVMPLSDCSLAGQMEMCKLAVANVKTILYNLLCSLNYMHSANIVHRDLKPANILVDDCCQVMLCDFGLSRTLPESSVGKHNG